MNQKKRLLVVFGSTNDKEKVLPGLIRATQEFQDLDIEVQFASADNTPDKVEDIIQKKVREELAEGERQRHVYITGAGLANILTGVAKNYTSLWDLNIGIPVSDLSSGGLSALLSTSEKPPRNPVLTVGINDSYAAINIAHRFLSESQERIVTLDTTSGIDMLAKLESRLGSIGLKYEKGGLSYINPNDIVVSQFSLLADDLSNIREVDRRLQRGRGIQVAVCNNPINCNFDSYARSLLGTSCTGLVSSEGYDNAAIVAAQLIQDHNALNNVEADKILRAAKLNEDKGLLISGGNVKEL